MSLPSVSPPLIMQMIDKIGRLNEYVLKAENANPETEPQNANRITNSECVVRCCKTHTEPNSPPVDPYLKLHDEFQKAEEALHKLKNMVNKDSSNKILAQHCCFLNQMQSLFNQMESVVGIDKGTHKEILEKTQLINETRQHIASLLTTSNSHHNDVHEPEFDAYLLVGRNQQGDMKKKIWKSSALADFYEDFEGVFKNLERKMKLCLLCFSAFPQDAVVKKRALLHWWIGEGFIGSHLEANEILQNLVIKGFIQPDLKKRRLFGFKMDRLVRLVVVRIAEELRFLSFDPMGVPGEDFSWSHKACLVERGIESSRLRLMKSVHPEKLHTIFNINDDYPDFLRPWFSKLKNLNVLCLGSWRGSARRHIEVEGTEFLTDLKIMKYLKLLSLQGISRITKLPDSVCELNSLLILDLKACHNLEALPKNLKALKNLTQLDLSECYLLDHIPEGLSYLKELQVFKGFFIGDSASKNPCRLEDLAQLKKLRKLSISTCRKDFPTPKEISALQSFEALENLTLAWRGKPLAGQARRTSEPQMSPADTSDAEATARTGEKVKRKTKGTAPVQPSESAQSAQPEQPKSLQKLELQCFPKTAPPEWLTEGKLNPEKKLYIIGGNLQSLCKVDSNVNEWSVKILRLKYLKGLEMDWSKLKNSFKELVYLEMVQCPRLKLFPCDKDGVWLNPTQVKKLEELKLGLTWSFLRRRTNNLNVYLNEETEDDFPF